MKNIRAVILTLLLTCASLGLSAQTQYEGESLKLEKQGAHYTFVASINGKANATVLLESGISAMLVDSAFVFSSGVLSDLELVPTAGKAKMNLGGRVYVITHKACGTVKIGENISYRGEVFVLSGYAENYNAAVPVQYLHNENDNGSRLVRLDLSNNILQLISRTSFRKQQAFSKVKMNTDTYLGMPAVETTVLIGYGSQSRKLKGNFNIDFGNPELLFLHHQHKDVQQFFADNSDIQLRQARNPRGEVVAQFMIAEECQICGTKFPNAVIAITENLPRFTTTGNIGLKFFNSIEAILDFDKNMMYLL